MYCIFEMLLNSDRQLQSTDTTRLQPLVGGTRRVCSCPFACSTDCITSYRPPHLHGWATQIPHTNARANTHACMHARACTHTYFYTTPQGYLSPYTDNLLTTSLKHHNRMVLHETSSDKRKLLFLFDINYFRGQ